MSASQPLSSTVTSTRSPVDVSTVTPTSTNDSAAESFTVPSLDAIFELKLPTLQHVPKGARDAWAALLSSVCLSIARDPSDLVLWSKFLMLPRCVLSSPVNGGRTHWREVQRLVKTRIQRFQAGDFSELWSEALVESGKYSRKRNPKKSSISLSKINASRARRAVEEGQYRKAIQALSSSGLANVTPDVIDEMLDLSKHPHSVPPTIPSYHPRFQTFQSLWFLRPLGLFKVVLLLALPVSEQTI